MHLSSLFARGTLALAGFLPIALVACAADTGGSSAETERSESTLQSSAPTPIAECSGVLPKICRLCADGASACAHWVRVDGKCDVEICGDPSTAPLPVPAPVPAPRPTPIASVCPPRERPCLVEAAGGACHTTCVGDTVLCIAPSACDPIVCDPPGAPPEKSGCTWDEKDCVWLCL